MRVLLNNFAMQTGGAMAFGISNVVGFDTFSAADGYVAAAFRPPQDSGGLKPAATSFNPGIFWSNGSGGGTGRTASKLQDRIRQLAEQGVELSHGFSRLLLNGDMQTQFAEMFILGLIVRFRKGETLSNETLRDVISSIRKTGTEPERLFSEQFNAELQLAGETLESYFEVKKEGGKTVIATKEEPREGEAEPEAELEAEVVTEAEPDRRGFRPAEIEIEILPPEADKSGAAGRAMVLAGDVGRGISLAMVPSKERLDALGLPSEALHAMAIVSPELAQHSITGMLQLELSTDPQKIADAIRVIRKLYSFAAPDEKAGLLKKLADIFLMYDEALKTESTENARRIRREVVSALQEIGIRRSFVKELETFTNGTEANKAIAIQGLSASLYDRKWEGDEAIKFAKYLIVRLVLAEIKSGSSAEILSAALDSVHVIAADIIAEGETDEFVSNLIIRAGAKDVSEEGSIVYSGLTALLNADRSAAIAAMEPQLRESLFQDTDVLIYRLLALHYDDPEKKRSLARRMVSDHVKIARMDRAIRQTLREAIVRSGETAVPFILDEYRQAEAAKTLSPERREDLVRMVFEIYAGLTPVQRQDLPLETREVIFGRAADKLYSEYRTSQHVLDGVVSLDGVRGQELLAFFKAKADAPGISMQERVFWIRRMAAKAAALRVATPEQAVGVSWAFTETLRLFEGYGNEHFETACLFFSSSAVSFRMIKPAFERISALPKSSRLPERDRAILVAMAGNHGLPGDFLVNTVGRKLEEIADRVFKTESAVSGVEFTAQELAEDVVLVTLALDHDSDAIIGDELRNALAGFVKDRKGRYGFKPKTGELSIKGEMSPADHAMLSGILAATHQEKIRIGKKELDERIKQRMAAIGSLQRMAAEKAKKSKDTAETMGVNKVFNLDDIDLASELSDSPPLKKFEDAMEGLARLYRNPQLEQDEKDKFLAKLMELHDRAVREVPQSSTDLGPTDNWSYAVVRPLVEIFVGGTLGRSNTAARAVTFIINNLTGGHLTALSRRALWGLFTKQLERFRIVPSVMLFITSKLRTAMEKDPQADWAPERGFLETFKL